MCLGKIMADSDHRVMSYDKLKLPNFQGPYFFNYFFTKMALWVLSALTFSYIYIYLYIYIYMYVPFVDNANSHGRVPTPKTAP